MSGRVVAFEPAGRERARLQRNLWLNRCTNVTIESKAVGAQVGAATLFEYARHQGSLSSLRPAAADVTAAARPRRVAVTTLDVYLGEHGGNPTLVKIDAEGAELEILQGARGTLRQHQPVVVCEVADIRTREWGYPATAIREYLEALGYDCMYAAADGRLVPELNSADYNVIAIPRAMRIDVSTRFAGLVLPAVESG